VTNYVIPPELDAWEAENVFYLKSAPSRIGKLLAHWEIYQEISTLPGAVVECGVYKGASLIRFATFRSLLECNEGRQIIGFDAFGDFPRESVGMAGDQSFIDRFENSGGGGISRTDLLKYLDQKGFRNVQLEAGPVEATVPTFLAENPALRISLLHLDLDVYEPTKFCIEQFLPHLSPGASIVFDDFGAVPGATRAADELCANFGLTLEKKPYYYVPSVVRWPGFRPTPDSA